MKLRQCCLRVLCAVLQGAHLPASGRLIVPGPKAGYAIRNSSNPALRHTFSTVPLVLTRGCLLAYLHEDVTTMRIES
jgi:hypothetical protein